MRKKKQTKKDMQTNSHTSAVLEKNKKKTTHIHDTR